MLLSGIDLRLMHRQEVFFQSGMRMWLPLLEHLRFYWVFEPGLFAFVFSSLFVSCMATLLRIQDGFTPESANASLLTVLWLDLGLLIIFAVMMFLRLLRSWAARFSEAAGRRLLIRIVTVFAAVALIPSLMLAGVSMLVLNVQVQSWFSEPVARAVEESRAIADAYLEEYRSNTRIDAVEVADAIIHLQQREDYSDTLIAQFLDEQALARGFSEIILFDASGATKARGGSALYTGSAGPFISSFDLERANEGQVVVLDMPEENSIGVLSRIADAEDTYIFMARAVEQVIQERIEQTKAGVALYDSLSKDRETLTQNSLMLFALMGFVLLAAAMALGFLFAGSISGPISRLIMAAQRVGEGSFDVSVPIPIDTHDKGDELMTLSRVFNTMTGQLGEQRAALIDANAMLDERRRFTEAVLAGVSAGVIGLDAKGQIDLPNKRASALLGCDLEQKVGVPLSQFADEFGTMLEQARTSSDGFVHHQMVLTNRRLERLTFNATVVTEYDEGRVTGYIVTFDDITQLVAAQRSAAWSDAARRVAHEIKNPLTPIQISAQRLQRRFTKQIEEGHEVFEQCTSTIIRQVDDIRQLVDEFSALARSSTPSREAIDMLEQIGQVIFLEQQNYEHIDYVLHCQDETAMAELDGRMFRQAVLNLLRNSAEAIEERLEQEAKQGGLDEKMPGSHAKGQIFVLVERQKEQYELRFMDNGTGFKSEIFEKVTQAYVTSKDKGTGLGLAIVRKIFEDHGGSIVTGAAQWDGVMQGACIRVYLPLEAGRTL